MSLAGKMFKAVAEGLEEGVKKKATTEALKKQAQEAVGTGLSSVAKETIEKEAKLGLNAIPVEQAREAGKQIYRYEAQALAAEERNLKTNFLDAVDMTIDKLQSRQITDQQALDIAYKINEAQTQKSLERQVAGTAPSQTLNLASKSDTAKLMNLYVREFPKVAAEQPAINLLKTMQDVARGSSKLNAEILKINKRAQKDGLGRKIYVNAQNFVKNAMLAQNPLGRLADAGGNVITRGITTIDLYMAEQATKAGNKLSKYLPEGVLRGVLAGDGVYSGETATMLNGMLNSIVDYGKTGSENIMNFIKSNKNGIRETEIGRNARKIDYQFTWDRENLVENTFAPVDMATIVKAVRENPLASVGKGALKAYYAPGYGITKGLDNVTAGSFRAGDLALNSKHYAISKAREIGQGENNKLISDLEKYFIERDAGNDVDGLEQSIQEYFGRDLLEDLSDFISREATDSAARDVYRLEPETTVGKTFNLIDEGIRKIPVVKYIYDWKFPFARVPFRILDRVVQENPFDALKDIFKEYRAAAEYVKGTGRVNSTNFYKAVGRFTQSLATYSLFGYLVEAGYVTGDRPKDRQVARMWEEKGIKENAFNIPDETGNIAFSLPYGKAGAPGETLSVLANMYTETKDIYDNYKNPAKPYGIPSALLNIVEMFASVPVWHTVFGQFAKEIDLGTLLENQGANLLKLFPRLTSMMEETFLMKDGEIAYKTRLNYGKNISDYKLDVVPRLGFWGTPIKDGIKTSENELLADIGNLGVKISEPQDTYNVTVDGETIELMPEQRDLWQQLLSGYEVKDSKASLTGRKTSLYQELYAAMHTNDYLLSGTSEYIRGITGDIVKNDRTKQGIVTRAYNQAKRDAFDYFLSFKDKVAKDEFEEKLKRNSIDLWQRAQDLKSMKLYTAPKPTIPTIK